MGLGKMTRIINIVQVISVKDPQGFGSTPADVVIASVRAYMESQHASERWANRAAFSTANALFRFRKIPGVEINSTMFIIDASGRYRIISVEDFRGKGMYLECLAEIQEGTVF